MFPAQYLHVFFLPNWNMLKMGSFLYQVFPSHNWINCFYNIFIGVSLEMFDICDCVFEWFLTCGFCPNHFTLSLLQIFYPFWLRVWLQLWKWIFLKKNFIQINCFYFLLFWWIPLVFVVKHFETFSPVLFFVREVFAKYPLLY